MCTNCSLFCFNWVFLEGGRWATTSRQRFISFYHRKDRNVWSERNMTAKVEPGVKHMQSRVHFSRLEQGKDTSLSDQLAHQQVHCQKVDQSQLQGLQWWTFARVTDCKFVKCKHMFLCKSVNSQHDETARSSWVLCIWIMKTNYL